MASDEDLTAAFGRESATYLRDVYMPRLREAVGTLSQQDLWWRPHGDTTSAGNLLLHLEGNIRQWILSGLAGEPDHRERDGEFAAREGSTGEDLLTALSATVDQVAAVLERVDSATLLGPFEIQGFGTTGLGAIYHIVEHFSWHTGQITWIAKLRAGEAHGVSYYDDDSLNAARNPGTD